MKIIKDILVYISEKYKQFTKESKYILDITSNRLN